MPVRVLFLNTRDQCGADVAVHLALMRHFTPEEAQVFVLSNSEAADARQMRAVFAEMPHVHDRFAPLGRPGDAFAGKSTLEKALAFVPTVASLARAVALIRAQKIDVIHATDRPRDASFAALLGRLTGAASVVHMHSSPGDHLSRPTLWGFRNADAIFAVSDFTRAGLIGMGLDAEKVHTVHNATDCDHFDPDAAVGSGAAIRQRYGIPADAPLAGIVARWNPWKGQRELIGALGLLRESHPNLRVLIVGNPVEKEKAVYDALAREAGVDERVVYAGFHSDVRPVLDALDLFVHPSFEEPFGLAITEAMAMRTPTIACCSGGVPEIITHGRDGWLVEPRSAEAVAAGIRTLLADPDLRRTLGEQGRETIRSRFSPRRQCALVAQTYATLTPAGAPAEAASVSSHPGD